MQTPVAEKARWAFHPWRDRRGKISPLRVLALLGCAAPAAWIAAWALNGSLGLIPVVPVLFYSGSFCLWLLLATLTVTPLRRMTGWNKLIGIRRIMGVSAFVYAVAHAVAYLALRNFDAAVIGIEIATRATVIVALCAILVLIVLTSTSTDRAVSRLGAAQWALIHKGAYLATALAIAHYMMSIGSTGGEPYVMAGFFLWLMGWRVLNRFKRAGDPRWLLAFGVVLALVTAAFEAGFLWLLNGFEPVGTLQFNFSLDLGLSPAWWVFGAGLLLTLLAAAMQLMPRRA